MAGDDGAKTPTSKADPRLVSMAAARRRFSSQEDKPPCVIPRLSLAEVMWVTGLVRTLAEEHAEVALVCRRDDLATVRRLYADKAEIVRFHTADTWQELTDLYARMEARGHRLVPLPSFRSSCPYAAAGRDRALARTAFEAQRHPEAEAELAERVAAAVGPTYVVVHDDDSRRIRPDLLPEGLPVVRVRDPRWRTPCILDWLETLRRAVQFHGIDSCFMVAADLLLPGRPRAYCHAYADAGAATASVHHYDGATTLWTASSA